MKLQGSVDFERKRLVSRASEVLPVHSLLCFQANSHDIVQVHIQSYNCVTLAIVQCTIHCTHMATTETTTHIHVYAHMHIFQKARR